MLLDQRRRWVAFALSTPPAPLASKLGLHGAFERLLQSELLYRSSARFYGRDSKSTATSLFPKIKEKIEQRLARMVWRRVITAVMLKATTGGGGACFGHLAEYLRRKLPTARERREVSHPTNEPEDDLPFLVNAYGKTLHYENSRSTSF
jgi:hypothetical protein